MPAAKVMLNLGALPPKQNAADMKKDGQNVSPDPLDEDFLWPNLIVRMKSVPPNTFREWNAKASVVDPETNAEDDSEPTPMLLLGPRTEDTMSTLSLM
jgi:hypothetical protein